MTSIQSTPVGAAGVRAIRRQSRSGARGRLRVALLAPPWIPIPPPGYGGIELVVAELAGGLVRNGHDVALLAAPGSCSDAQVVTLLEDVHPEQIGDTMVDVDHVGRAAGSFDHRLPEVFAGCDEQLTHTPVSYPTASSPQAWAAGAPLLLLSTVLGLAPRWMAWAVTRTCPSASATSRSTACPVAGGAPTS